MDDRSSVALSRSTMNSTLLPLSGILCPFYLEPSMTDSTHQKPLANLGATEATLAESLSTAPARWDLPLFRGSRFLLENKDSRSVLPRVLGALLDVPDGRAAGSHGNNAHAFLNLGPVEDRKCRFEIALGKSRCSLGTQGDMGSICTSVALWLGSHSSGNRV